MTTRTIPKVGTTKTVDITPHPSLMEKQGLTGDTIANRVNELVANSVDSRPDGMVRVDITVHNRHKSNEPVLTVLDTGPGMDETTFINAFTLGLSSKSGKAIGTNGVGLKASCTALGAYATVTTWQKGDKVAKQLVYDKFDFTSWQTTLKYVAIPGGGQPSGTLVEIAKTFNKPERILKELQDNLPLSNNQLIKSGRLVLSINSQPVPATEPELVYEKVIVNAKVGDKNVTGWVGVTKNFIADNGLWVIRNGQVIQKIMGFSEKDKRLDHNNFNYLYGELNTTNVAVSSNKAHVQKTEDWWALLEILEPQIEPVMRAAAKYRESLSPNVNQKRKEAMAAVAKVVAEKLKKLDFGAATVSTKQDTRDLADDNETISEIKPFIPRAPKSDVTPKDPMRENAPPKFKSPGGFNISHTVEHMGEGAAHMTWTYVDGEVRVTSNLDHPRVGQVHDDTIVIDDMVEAAVLFYLSRQELSTENTLRAMVEFKDTTLRAIYGK